MPTCGLYMVIEPAQYNNFSSAHQREGSVFYSVTPKSLPSCQGWLCAGLIYFLYLPVRTFSTLVTLGSSWHNASIVTSAFSPFRHECNCHKDSGWTSYAISIGEFYLWSLMRLLIFAALFFLIKKICCFKIIFLAGDMMFRGHAIGHGCWHWSIQTCLGTYKQMLGVLVMGPISRFFCALTDLTR